MDDMEDNGHASELHPDNPPAGWNHG